MDVWSLGVILYIPVSRTTPFRKDSKCGLELKQQILQANHIYYPQLFDSITLQAKVLTDKCLKVDQNERISSDEILLHPWLQDEVVLWKAKGLMATQTRGRKRLLENVDEDTSDRFERKKMKYLNCHWNFLACISYTYNFVIVNQRQKAFQVPLLLKSEN